MQAGRTNRSASRALVRVTEIKYAKRVMGGNADSVSTAAPSTRIRVVLLPVTRKARAIPSPAFRHLYLSELLRASIFDFI